MYARLSLDLVEIVSDERIAASPIRIRMKV